MKSTRPRSSRSVVLVDELGVGERVQVDACQQEIRGDVLSGKGASQFPPKSIVPDDSKNFDASSAEGCKIIGNRSARARSSDGSDHCRPYQARLDGRNRNCRIVPTPPIEANVADNEDSQTSDSVEDPGYCHELFFRSSRRSAGNVIR